MARDLRLPEAAASIERAERDLGLLLPADYKFFLMWSDGGELLKPYPYFRFYELADVVSYFYAGLPDGVIEIGTNDVEGFVFDTTIPADTSRYPVLRYSLGERARADAALVADHLADFVCKLLQAHPAV